MLVLSEILLCFCLQFNESTAYCAPALCPIGQVGNDRGQCVFMSTSWTTSGYTLFLKLVPRSKVVAGDIPPAISVDNFHGPWSKNWAIRAFFVTYDDWRKGHNDPNNTVLNIVVVLINSVRIVRPDSFVPYVKSRVQIPWIVDLRHRQVEAYSVPLEYTVQTKMLDGTKYLVPMFYGPVINSISLEQPMISSILYTSPLFRTTFANVFPITKLLWCLQVSVPMDEFEVIVNGKVVTYRRLNKTLYENEFTAIEGLADDNPLIKVCAEDLGFSTEPYMSCVSSTSWFMASRGCNLLTICLYYLLSALLQTNKFMFQWV